MAIVGTNLTHGNSLTSGTGFTTASITPAANNLILIAFDIKNTSGASPSVSSVTGNGLTWTVVTSSHWNTSGSQRTLFVYEALGASPSIGAITVTTGETDTFFSWVVDEFSGTDTATPIVQSASNLNNNLTSSLTVTLAAFGNANNASYGAFGEWNALTLTPVNGWSVLGNDDASTNGVSTWTEYKSTQDTSVVGNFGSTDNIGGIGIEIKAATVTNIPRPNVLPLLGIG